MVLAGPFGVSFSDIMGLILKYDGTPLFIRINNGTDLMLNQLCRIDFSRLYQPTSVGSIGLGDNFIN